MMRRENAPWISPVVLAVLFLSAGCHMVVGPDDGEQSWWYFCDPTGCYPCDRYGCDIRDDSCSGRRDCPSDSSCDPSTRSCRTDAKCQDGTCVPGKPVERCTSGSACDDGLCLDGACGACSGDCGGGTTCQFNRHCGAGRVCLDGQCTNSCTGPRDCGSGQACVGQVCAPRSGTCVKTSECQGDAVCVNNTCLETCTLDGKCGNAADRCSAAIASTETSVQVCLPDNASSPECKLNVDCDGEVCVNGVCRTACEGSEDCVACEDGPVCAGGGFCMTEAEANPGCRTSRDCTGALVCLDAKCVAL